MGKRGAIVAMLLEHFTAGLWEGKTSIYDYIREQGEEINGSLPDDDEFWSGSSVRWVAGGLSGMMRHLASQDTVMGETRQLVRMLAKHTRRPRAVTRKALYALFIKEDLIRAIDTVLNEVRQDPGIQYEALFEEAKWLARYGAHRNAVKFGIALLGMFEHEDAEIKELLLTLGRHDEFTLYSVVAILNGLEEGNELVFELAQAVQGWGKIQAVERLEPTHQRIKDWLLRHGCVNQIMNEYLACVCARKGELHKALAAEKIDNELYEGATDIIDALLCGGPAEDVYDYEYSPQALTGYVRHAEQHCKTTRHLTVLLNIRYFLSNDKDERWAELYRAGWTLELREHLLTACEAMISRSDWPAVILETLRSREPNAPAPYYCFSSAARLGMDIWDEVYTQAQLYPTEVVWYYELMTTEQPERIRRMVKLGEQKLPLEQIASGPREEQGFGKEYDPHRCLGIIVQGLDKLPGTGRPLLLAALRSPVTSNRSAALMALEAWESDTWGAELKSAVAALLDDEVDEELRQQISELKEQKRF